MDFTNKQLLIRSWYDVPHVQGALHSIKPVVYVCRVHCVYRSQPTATDAKYTCRFILSRLSVSNFGRFVYHITVKKIITSWLVSQIDFGSLHHVHGFSGSYFKHIFWDCIFLPSPIYCFVLLVFWCFGFEDWPELNISLWHYFIYH